MGKGNKGGVSSNTHTSQQLNNYANQSNPNNSAYAANRDNHANQCNPNSSKYAGNNTATNEK